MIAESNSFVKRWSHRDEWGQYIDPSCSEQAIRIEVADDGRVHLHADLWDVRALAEAQVFGTGSWR